MWLHRLQMSPDMALNPMERSGTMIFLILRPQITFMVMVLTF